MRIGPLAQFALSFAKLVIILAGVVATISLAMAGSPRPLVRVVRVDGDSMVPTLRSGEELLFARAPWRVGSIVLANVGDTEPVVKRVMATLPGSTILLQGDNWEISEIYSVQPSDLLGVCVARSIVRLPSLARSPGPDVTAL